MQSSQFTRYWKMASFSFLVCLSFALSSALLFIPAYPSCQISSSQVPTVRSLQPKRLTNTQRQSFLTASSFYRSPADIGDQSVHKGPHHVPPPGGPLPLLLCAAAFHRGDPPPGLLGQTGGQRPAGDTPGATHGGTNAPSKE